MAMAEEKLELLPEDAGVTPHEDSTAKQYEQTTVEECKHIIGIEDSKETMYTRMFDKFKAPEITRFLRPTTYADKVITAVYVLSIICAIAMTVLYFATDETISQFLSLMIVCVTIWVGGVVGMIALNKGFTVVDQTSELSKKHQEYCKQLKILSGKRERVLGDLKETRNIADVLHTEEKKLSERAAKFGDLMDEFNKMSTDFGDEFHKMISSFKKTDGILKGIQHHNHRAILYRKFYEASKEDKKEGLSEKEYKEFLYEIDKEYRDKFDKFKDLDLDDNGNISQIEFGNAVSKVLIKLKTMQEVVEPN
eukprot:247038_1